MNHLDEGTIHAWLDNELATDQAQAVEEHVRDCRTCADAVAEARGLMAASSRILGALDDVPANVIPKVPVRKTRSMWRAAPWVTGIAAVLVAAVVLTTGDDASRTPSAVMEARVADFADTQVASVAVQPPPPAASSPTVASRRLEAAQTRPTVGPQREKAVQPTVRAGSAAGAGAVTGSVASAAAPEVTVTSGAAGADARASRRLAASEVAADRARESFAVAGRAEERARAVAAPPSAPAAVAPQRSVLLDMRAERPLDPLRDTIAEHRGLAGCYVVVLPARGGGFAAGLAATRQRADTRAAPSAAAAPADAGTQSRITVRLDTLRGTPGYVVRVARSDSSLGWWRRVARDSAQLDLLRAGRLKVSATQRITCPEPLQ